MALQFKQMHLSTAKVHVVYTVVFNLTLFHFDGSASIHRRTEVHQYTSCKAAVWQDSVSTHCKYRHNSTYCKAAVWQDSVSTHCKYRHNSTYCKVSIWQDPVSTHCKYRHNPTWRTDSHNRTHITFEELETCYAKKCEWVSECVHCDGGRHITWIKSPHWCAWQKNKNNKTKKNTHYLIWHTFYLSPFNLGTQKTLYVFSNLLVQHKVQVHI